MDPGAHEPAVGLFVDGPNLFRAEFDVDLGAVREAAAAAGRVATARIYLDEQAPASLVRAAEAHGFEVAVTGADVDVRLATDATAAAVDAGLDVLVVASRDGDFRPLFEHAGRHGVRTVAVAPGEHGRSGALVAAADEAVVLDG